jgi:MFS family permease
VTAELRALVEPAARRNVLALGVDYALFLVGLSFASQATILPAFAAHLGASNLVIGAIPAVMTAGWYLPSLFFAGHTQSLERKLPFVLRYTAWERVPFLLLTLVAVFLATPAPGLSLAALLGLLAVSTGTGGVLMPAWMDVIGRCVPATMRGRFFGVASTLAGIGGLLGSGVTAYVLATVPAPGNYGVCFLLAALFMGLSWMALAMVREPSGGKATAPAPLGPYLRAVSTLARRDVNFGWFLLGRTSAVLGAMASGFYTVYALSTFASLPWHVGLFTAALLAGQVASNPLLGWLADVAGHRAVILVGAGAVVAANLLALLAPSLEIFVPVFVLAGVHQATINVSGLPILLDFAPTIEERPTYVGLGNTALGPAMFVAPLAAGVLADALGYRNVFMVAGAFGLAGVVMLLLRVRDPRSLAPNRSPRS